MVRATPCSVSVVRGWRVVPPSTWLENGLSLTGGWRMGTGSGALRNRTLLWIDSVAIPISYIWHRYCIHGQGRTRFGHGRTRPRREMGSHKYLIPQGFCFLM